MAENVINNIINNYSHTNGYTPEKIKELIKRYPFLRPYNGWTGEFEDLSYFDYSYLPYTGDIPTGWVPMFLQLCEDLRIQLEKENALNDFYLVQVKEKFNELRCYTGPRSKEIEDIISKYMHVSPHVCSCCGKPATYETEGYILSYCDDCFKDEIKDGKCIRHTNGHSLEPFNPIITFEVFSNDEYTTRELDSSDVWKKLYSKK